MKRIIALLLACVMAFTGCSSANTNDKEAADNIISIEEDKVSKTDSVAEDSNNEEEKDSEIEVSTQTETENENNIEVAFGTIDIFSKGNFKDILEDVKNILKSNGFLVTDVASEMYEEDTKYFHVPVNFCKEGEIEDA